MTSDVLPAAFASNNSLINSSNCCSVDLPGKKPNWQGEMPGMDQPMICIQHGF